MPLAEDQDLVGDLGSDGEHEPFRVLVRARAARRDPHGRDTRVGQDCVERPREPVGAEYCVTLRDLRIFMDQAPGQAS